MIKITRGRPTDLRKSKNRVHQIVLTEKAEVIFRETVKKRNGDTKWFHRFVSEHIIRDFENGSQAFILHLLLEKQKVRKKLDEEINNLAIEFQKIKKKEEELLIGVRA